MAQLKDVAVYFDASKCTACKGCQVACKQWNQLPSALDDKDYEFDPSFTYPRNNTGDTWLHMNLEETEDSKGNLGWAFGRVSCQHCTDAACVDACPTGACHKTAEGAVVIDQDKCIGCKYCVAACPFSVPKFRERDDKTQKCTMCLDRIENDRRPACVTTCPTGALQFGDRYDMIALAKTRLNEIKPNRPDAMIYGLTEMGGLHVIQVLPYGPKAHHLPENPEVSVLTLASKFMKPIAGIGALAVAALSGIAFIGARGYKRDVDDWKFDPKTGITYDKGVPIDDEHKDATAEASTEVKGGE